MITCSVGHKGSPSGTTLHENTVGRKACCDSLGSTAAIYHVFLTSLMVRCSWRKEIWLEREAKSPVGTVCSYRQHLPPVNAVREGKMPVDNTACREEQGAGALHVAVWKPAESLRANPLVSLNCWGGWSQVLSLSTSAPGQIHCSWRFLQVCFPLVCCTPGDNILFPGEELDIITKKKI